MVRYSRFHNPVGYSCPLVISRACCTYMCAVVCLSSTTRCIEKASKETRKRLFCNYVGCSKIARHVSDDDSSSSNNSNNNHAEGSIVEHRFLLLFPCAAFGRICRLWVSVSFSSSPGVNTLARPYSHPAISSCIPVQWIYMATQPVYRPRCG